MNNNERICLLSCTLPIDDKMADVWNRFAKELRRNSIRLVMLTTTENSNLNFEFIKIPFLLNEFNELNIFLTDEFFVDENLTALTMTQREIEWFNREKEDWLNYYKGYYKCKSFYRSIILLLNPSVVIAWQNSLPQSNILKRLAEEYSIPNLIMERGLLPDTFMLEKTGNVALSDIINCFSLRKVIIENEHYEDYEKIKTYYRENKPIKYIQKNYDESLHLLNDIRSQVKLLIVYFANVDSSVGVYPGKTNLSYKTSSVFNNSRESIKKLSEIATAKDFQLIIKLHPHDNSDYRQFENENTKILKDFNYQLLMEKGDILVFSCTTLQVEGLLYEKPLLLLCNTELSGFNIAYEVNTVEQLVHQIDAALSKSNYNQKELNAKKFIHWISNNFLFSYYENTPVKNGMKEMSNYISQIGFYDKNRLSGQKIDELNFYLTDINYGYPYKLNYNGYGKDNLKIETNKVKNLRALLLQYEMNPINKSLLLEIGEHFINEKEFLTATRFFQKAEMISDGIINDNDKLSNNFDYEHISSVPELSFEEIIKKAENLIEQNNFSDAKIILESLLTNEPNNIDALNDLGVVAMLEKDYNTAADKWIKVLSIDKNNEIAIQNMVYLDKAIKEVIASGSNEMSYEEKQKYEEILRFKQEAEEHKDELNSSSQLSHINEKGRNMDNSNLMFSESDFLSHIGQDAWVAGCLNNKKNGYFLDFGAFDGKTISNTYFLEKRLNWKGICVEPNPRYYELLCNYRDVILINNALWKTSRQSLRFLDAHGLSSFEEFAKSDCMFEKRANATNKVIYVDTINPNELLQRFNSPLKIDYLSLDVEGCEFEILSSIDLEKYSISLITIEHNHDETRQNRYRDYLSKYGYDCVQNRNEDWFYNKIYLANSNKSFNDPNLVFNQIFNTYQIKE